MPSVARFLSIPLEWGKVFIIKRNAVNPVYSTQINLNIYINVCLCIVWAQVQQNVDASTNRWTRAVTRDGVRANTRLKCQHTTRNKGTFHTNVWKLLFIVIGVFYKMKMKLSSYRGWSSSLYQTELSTHHQEQRYISHQCPKASFIVTGVFNVVRNHFGFRAKLRWLST